MDILNRHNITFYTAVVKLFIVILLCLLCTPGHAQKITAVTDRNKILIGEQVSLVVKAEEINTRTTELAVWIAVQDSSGHLQVVRNEPVDTIELNGYTTYIQKFAVTSFDSGKWVIAPLKLVLTEKASGKQLVLTTPPVVIDVLPVDVAGLAQYHDIKEIQEVEVTPNYILYAAVALSVAGLGILLWLIFRNKKSAYIKVPAGYKDAALAIALKRIKELENEKLPSQNKFKAFYTKLTGICREYFFEQLQLRSAQLTSDEMMLMLSVYFQHQKKRSDFYQLLRLADAVKFAKYNPSPEENAGATETAADSLKYVDSVLQQVKTNIPIQNQQPHRKTPQKIA